MPDLVEIWVAAALAIDVLVCGFAGENADHRLVFSMRPLPVPNV